MQNVFGSSAPNIVNVGNDSDQITLGHVFKVTQAGLLYGLRYYEGNAGAPARTGAIWTIGGTLLGTLTFDTPANVNAWNEKNFASPISLAANTPYVYAVYFNTGNWSATFNDLATDKVSGDITLYGYLNDPASIGQGRYDDTALALVFPSNASGGHSSYGVDVLFDVAALDVNLDGSSSLTLGSSGAIEVTHVLSGSSSITFGSNGSLVSVHLLSGNSALVLGSSADLVVTHFLQGASGLSLGATGNLRVTPQTQPDGELAYLVEFEIRGTEIPFEDRGIHVSK